MVGSVLPPLLLISPLRLCPSRRQTGSCLPPPCWNSPGAWVRPPPGIFRGWPDGRGARASAVSRGPNGLRDRGAARCLAQYDLEVAAESRVVGHRAKGRPYLVDDERARMLHARGLSDTAIAAALGRPCRTITSWRRRAGLPRNSFERSGQAPTAPPVPPILQQMMAAARRPHAALTAAWGRQ